MSNESHDQSDDNEATFFTSHKPQYSRYEPWFHKVGLEAEDSE